MSGRSMTTEETSENSDNAAFRVADHKKGEVILVQCTIDREETAHANRRLSSVVERVELYDPPAIPDPAQPQAEFGAIRNKFMAGIKGLKRSVRSVSLLDKSDFVSRLVVIHLVHEGLHHL